MDKGIYLGQLISFENRTEKEIETRISKTWKKFWSLKNIFKGPFKLKQKREIFNLCTLPTLTHGSETWSLNEKIINKIKVTQNTLERSILNTKRREHVPTWKIKAKLRKKEAVRHIRRQKWGWAGHTARYKDDRWIYRTTFWQTLNFKRRKGKQKTRWRG